LGNLSIFLGVNHGRVIWPVIFQVFLSVFSFSLFLQSFPSVIPFSHFFQFVVLVFFLPFLSGAFPRLLALSSIKGNPHVRANRGVGFKRS